MNHTNVIRFLDFFSDNQFFYLVTEMHGAEWRHDNPRLNPIQNPSLRVPAGDHPKVESTVPDYSTMDDEQVLQVRRTARDLFECIDAQ